MEKMLVVYRIFFDHVDGSYIGITNNIETRKKKHLYFAKKGIKGKLYNAIRKYKNPKFEILDVCQNEQILLEKEKQYIQDFDSYKNGLNSTLGGEGTFGSTRKKSSEWCKKQSERMLGEKNPKFGKVFTEQEKKQHSIKMKEFYRNNPHKKAWGNKSSSGKKWVNNGTLEMKIHFADKVPEGFNKGRLFKKRLKNGR